MRRSLVALGITVIVFLIYRATLLPGFDFGDTGSFQTMAGSPVITPRDAYPLYLAVGDALLALRGGDPAHAFNLASAIEAAIACGLLVLVSAELSGSLVAGVAAALFFAGSYTYWSQAIIAEVYALHALFVSLTLLLLLRWEATPSLLRLSLFFAAYALGFGNHLSMVLLLPAYALFLMQTAPSRWKAIVAPRVLALAAAFAVAGALQYAWNIRGLWISMTPPSGIVSAIGGFWFDTTKTDWRATTVLSVPSSMEADRLRMYGFDLLQQYGRVGVGLALLGIATLAVSRPKRAVLLFLMYVANAIFALTYNVGDTHVFLLPSHLVAALSIGCGIGAWQRTGRFVTRRFRQARADGVALYPSLVGLAVVALAVFRIWDNYPALDRSQDNRPEQTLAALTSGLDDRRAILIEDVNWQVENGLTYLAKRLHPEVAFTRLEDVSPYVAALTADNQAIGRDVALTERARRAIDGENSALQAVRDDRAPLTLLADVVQALPSGTRYVMCILRPSREFPFDDRDLGSVVERITAGAVRGAVQDDYQTIAGLVGAAPILRQSANSPFRVHFLLDGVRVDVRMESWLAFDTIRRMGFGQVVANRHHALIVERGVSFVALDGDGQPLRTSYSGDIFAPQARYVLRVRH